MFNNSDIKCFLTLVKTLSFIKTGQILFMSQQAVSQRISNLEKDIGLMLFIRSRNYVRLTKAGEKIYSFLSAMRDSYKSLIAECLNDVAQMSKSLRVKYQNMLDWGPILNILLYGLRK
jgi:DNA-binding transcriptional LysR family regulator